MSSNKDPNETQADDQTPQQQPKNPTAEAPQSEEPLHILITGTSQGIGLAAAQQLIQDGHHHVYHACRSHDRAKQAALEAGGGIVLEEACDLSDLDSIKRFAKEVIDKVPHLDVLCLNAGIAPSYSSKKDNLKPLLTAQGFESCIGINHIGHFLLLQLLLPKLMSRQNAKRPACIVITASAVHDPAQKAGQSGGTTATLGDISGLGVNLAQADNITDLPTMIDGSLEYSGGKAYKDSKLCNILMCRQAAKLYKDKNICCCSFSPGLVPTTGLFAPAREESWWKMHAFATLASVMGISVPVQVAAERLVYMVTAPDTEIVNGAYYGAQSKSRATTPQDGFVEIAASTEASSDIIAQQLWERSLEVVHDWL